MIAAAISAPTGRAIWPSVTPANRSLLMAPVRRLARSCSALYRMIESVLRQTRCLVFTPPGVLVFSASRSLMTLPHARCGTSIRCQFDSGSAAMAGSVSQQFICPAESSKVCTDNAADACRHNEETHLEDGDRV